MILVTISNAIFRRRSTRLTEEAEKSKWSLTDTVLPPQEFAKKSQVRTGAANGWIFLKSRLGRQTWASQEGGEVDIDWWPSCGWGGIIGQWRNKWFQRLVWLKIVPDVPPCCYKCTGWMEWVIEHLTVLIKKSYLFFHKRRYNMATSSQHQGHNRPFACNEWHQQ